MNSPRTILFIAFLVVTFFLYQTWLVETAPRPVQPASTSTTATNGEKFSVPDANNDLPVASNDAVPSAADDGSIVSATSAAPQSQLVRVTTDVLDVLIDPRGGDIVNAKLVQYNATLDSNNAFELLHNNPSQLYVAQSGLVGANGTDSASGRPLFRVEQTNYQLTGDSVVVPLTLTREDGSEIRKSFIFNKGSYAIAVRYDITNNSSEPQRVQFYGQLKQVISEGSGNMMMPTYSGGAYSWDEDRYEKYAFDDMKEQRLNRQTSTGWVAMLEHYFASAWIPTGVERSTLFSNVTSSNHAIMGVMYPATEIAPGTSATIESTLFVGPKDQDAMAQVAENLDLTVDYGFLWWLAQPIFKLLQFMQSFLVNWGLAIIGTTVVIKAILYPLTKAQYVSMAKMRLIQPKMMALRERFGNDRQKMSQAMMKLYKEEKVNPLGGCFPMLLQLPIFLALYWVLLESVELRHAPLFLWIEDLSAKDPYYILPLLMGASMWFMQKLQPSPATDPMQQKLLQWMPVIFTIFFLWFPSGLVLYWLVSNVITIIQMLIIYRGLEKQGLMTRKKA